MVNKNSRNVFKDLLLYHHMNKKGEISARSAVFSIGFLLGLIGLGLASLASYGIIPSRDPFTFGVIIIISELIVSAGIGLMSLSRGM